MSNPVQNLAVSAAGKDLVATWQLPAMPFIRQSVYLDNVRVAYLVHDNAKLDPTRWVFPGASDKPHTIRVDSVDAKQAGSKAEVKYLPPVTPLPPPDPRPVYDFSDGAKLQAKSFDTPCIIRLHGVLRTTADVRLNSSDIDMVGMTPDATIKRVHNSPFSRPVNVKRGASNVLLQDFRVEGVDEKYQCASGPTQMKALAISGVSNLKLIRLGFANVGDAIMHDSANNVLIDGCYTFGPLGRCFWYLESKNSLNVTLVRCKINHPSLTENVLRIDETGTDPVTGKNTACTGVSILDTDVAVNFKSALSARSFDGLLIDGLRVHAVGGKNYPISLGGGNVKNSVARNATLKNIASAGQIEIGAPTSGSIEIINCAVREIAVAPNPDKGTVQTPATCTVHVIDTASPVKWYLNAGQTPESTKVRVTNK